MRFFVNAICNIKVFTENSYHFNTLTGYDKKKTRSC